MKWVARNYLMHFSHDAIWHFSASELKFALRLCGECIYGLIAPTDNWNATVLVLKPKVISAFFFYHGPLQAKQLNGWYCNYSGHSNIIVILIVTVNPEKGYWAIKSFSQLLFVFLLCQGVSFAIIGHLHKSGGQYGFRSLNALIG